MAGEGALFASARTITRGTFNDGALEKGALPGRSATAAEVRAGDVLVALRGASNSAAAMLAELAQPVFATLDLAVLRPNAALDASYLAWFINLPASQAVLAGDRVSGGVPRLPLAALEMLPIPTPPLEVQHGIAAIDDLARHEVRMNAELLRLRAVLLQTTLSTIAAQRSA